MRKIAGVLLVVGMLLPVGLAAPPAGAATVMTCTKMTGAAKWSPAVSPLKSVAHDVTATGKFSGCTGFKGITSGTFTFTAKGKTKQNCVQLIASKAVSIATSAIKWNNGKASVSAKVTLAPIATATLKVTAKVSTGTVFVGKTAHLVSQFVPVAGGCVTAGKSLTSATLSFKAGTKLTIS